MAKISRTRGKNTELRVAKFWGGRRNHFEREDIHHRLLSIEVKGRARIPATLRKWFTQAVGAAPDGKIPVVHIHEAGSDYTDDLCLIRASDLRDIVDEAQ